jgi:hypothetical protein
MLKAEKWAEGAGLYREKGKGGHDPGAKEHAV